MVNFNVSHESCRGQFKTLKLFLLFVMITYIMRHVSWGPILFLPSPVFLFHPIIIHFLLPSSLSFKSNTSLASILHYLYPFRTFSAYRLFCRIDWLTAKFLLALVSTAILVAESHGTLDHILLPHSFLIPFICLSCLHASPLSSNSSVNGLDFLPYPSNRRRQPGLSPLP
jgi:hypothetical protein